MREDKAARVLRVAAVALLASLAVCTPATHPAGARQRISFLMHQLIYFSQATASLTGTQLEELLAQARQFNAAHGLTGILLYGNDQFLQVLEGDAATIHSLYARICQDPRHHDVVTYADGAITARVFADWHMGYHPLVPEQFLEFAGYISPAQLHVEQADLSPADTQLFQLLRAFLLPSRPKLNEQLSK